MTTLRRSSYLVGDDLGTPTEMAADCRAAGRNLGLQDRLEDRLDRAARAAATPAPSLRFEDYPAEVGNRGIKVSEAAARLAGALHLHLE